MMKLSAIVLALVFVNSLNIVLSQQNSLSQCRIVCDDEQTAREPVGTNYLPRGKMGEKGEKGDVGSPGQKGESNKHVISKHAKKIEMLETKTLEQSDLIEKKSVLVEKLSELVQSNSELIDELSSKFSV